MPPGPGLALLACEGMGDLGEFETYMLSWGAAATTVSKRLVVIDAMLAELGEPQEVDPSRLQGWLANGDWSQWTRVTYFGHLRSYFGWLAETGRITADPTAGLRRPKTPKPKPRPITTTEARAALGAARGHRHMWLLLGLFAGLRAHEIAKMRGEDVTADALFVVGKGRKAAEVPTHPDVWAYARHYPRTGHWFPSPRFGHAHIEAAAVTNGTTVLFRSLGIEGSIHRCRHYYATQLLRSGVSVRVVQTLMRHDSLATTAAYLAVDEEERVAAVRGLVA